MREINCHIPIRLRVTGRPSDAQLAQLAETLVRTLSARIEQAASTINGEWRSGGDARARSSFDTGLIRLASTASGVSAAAPRSEGPAPDLREYIGKIYALAREAGIERERTESIVARLLDALKGLDLRNQDNFTFVTETIAQLFPGHILTGFLIRVDVETPLRQRPSAARERFERQFERMAVGRNRYTGGYGPGLLLPLGAQTLSAVAGEASEAVSSVVLGMPGSQSILQAVGTADAFLAGVFGGLRDSIGQEEMERLLERLGLASSLSVAFSPVFMAGGVKGIVEDLYGVLKQTFGLLTGELGEFLAAAMEVMSIITSTEGRAFGFQLGLEVGREYAQQIIEASRKGLVEFIFDLGRLVGPAIIYTILTLLGIPQLLGAVMAARVFKALNVLKPLLKNEQRVMRLLHRIEERTHQGTHAPSAPAPETRHKSEAERSAPHENAGDATPPTAAAAPESAPVAPGERAPAPQPTTTKGVSDEEGFMPDEHGEVPLESPIETQERLGSEAHPEWRNRPRSETPLPERTRTETPLRSLGHDIKRQKKGYFTRKKPPLMSPYDFLESLSDIERHHFWPMYLKGLPTQTLTPLPRHIHNEIHNALDRWKGGKFSRRAGKKFYETMSVPQIMDELREFYRTAEHGRFVDFMPDFERAIRETLEKMASETE